jgi:hypothetical protein
MKTTGLLFAFLLVLVSLMTFPADAQTTTVKQTKLGAGGGLLLYQGTDIDSTATVSSDWFTMADYDDQSFVTYPPTIAILQTSTTAKPHVTTTIEASFNAEDVALILDTLETVADSAETLQITTLTTFSSYKFPYYRIKSVGEAGNRADVYKEVWIYIAKKD